MNPLSNVISVIGVPALRFIYSRAFFAAFSSFGSPFAYSSGDGTIPVTSVVIAGFVPGSQNVKREAEKLGLDKIFKDANFEWRNSGCSMCLGMNPDILAPGERCASTSNRNFEGRQGTGGRTHLVSPIMAAAAAIEGHFVDIREWF